MVHSEKTIQLSFYDTKFRDLLAKIRFEKVLSFNKKSITSVKNKKKFESKGDRKNFLVMQNSFNNYSQREPINYRVDELSKLASVAKTYLNKKRDLRVLCIGPRSEYELFSLFGHGFSTITAIDVFSYSDYINRMDLMDLEESAGWDIIVMGYVLPYLQDPKSAILKLKNCLAYGGYLVIGSTRTFYSLDEWQSKKSSGISEFTKVVFSIEDELHKFVNDASEGELYEVCRSCGAFHKDTLNLILPGSMTCMYQREIQHKEYSSRSGHQKPLRLQT